MNRIAKNNKASVGKYKYSVKTGGKVEDKKVNCNYGDNYYGDQVCIQAKK